MPMYIATRIINGHIAYPPVEFESATFEKAKKQANEGVDPLLGEWVDVRPAPEDQ